MAIATDPTWKDNTAEAGMNGMRAARAIALLSYRSYQGYLNSQSEENNEVVDNFKASSYQQYQGEKLHQRFNAFTYWFLSKAMDSHNVGRGRNGIPLALARIKANTTIV
jgi:homoserine O-acetyltransferase